MSASRLTIQKIFIVAFCVWHMFAIAAYLLPRTTSSRTWNLLAGDAYNLARPYILSMSQWQKWDIFSPDPLRRSSFYSLETLEGERWRELKIVDFAHLPWYDRAKELKILGRLEETWSGMTPTYLERECVALSQAAGKQLRLQARSYVLPKTMEALSGLSMNEPHSTLKTLGTVQCPVLPPA